MAKMKAYATFADWKKDQSARNQRLITKVGNVIKAAAPHLTKIVKWGQGVWADGDTPKAFIHAEEDHIQFGFYAGSSLKDPKKLLIGKGKYVRHVRIETQKDIDAKALSAFIRQVTK